MKKQLEQAIAQVVQEVLGVETTLELTRPEEQFGDFATNVALQLAKQVGKNPREIAEDLAAKLRDELKEQVGEVTVAGTLEKRCGRLFCSTRMMI
jgi:arginyl-tRNA synthetase